MALPAPRSEWPPPALQPALNRFATHEAWWSGDTDTLADHYGSGHSGAAHPAQYAGGIVGRAARFWWGRPPAAGEPHAKLHVPLAGDICKASADLLFSEPLSVTSDDTATATRLGELLDEHGQAKLLESAEVCAAMGGVYLRPVADPTISDRAWLDAVAPDVALPEWRWGRLTAVTFWRIVQGDRGFVYRHFEHHQRGRIVHALYRGDDSAVGVPVPLDWTDATADLAPRVDEDGGVDTGYDRLDVTYIPNMLPNRRWRSKPALAPMGRSDLDGCEPILDALDETYSSWMRDVRLAKGRVYVPAGMLDTHGPGRGASFDPDREFYAEVPGMLGSKDQALTVHQFGIRVAEHRDTCRELVDVALRHAGYAGNTVGIVREGGGLKTATEVTADERRSLITAGRKRGYWTPALARSAFPALLAIDAATFKRTVPPGPVHVEFADSVAEDALTLANTADVLNRAQAASTATRVRLVHPDWSDDQVDDEVQLIDAAGIPALAAPFDYGTGEQPTETDDQRAATGETQPEITAEQANTFGTLVRSGADPIDAARRAGLGNLKLTGGVPVTLRKPEPIAADAPAP